MPMTLPYCPRGSRTIPPRWLLALLCLCVMWSGGCWERKRPAVQIRTEPLAHPIVPQANTQLALMDPPDLPMEIVPIPEQFGVPRNPPARPHVASAPAPEPKKVEKASEPIIAPGISDDQLAAAKIETQHSLIVAERNLATTQGKPLSAAQGDLVSKIRGFMDASREAMNSGDWPRARSLAKKAEVLSQEFTESQ